MKGKSRKYASDADHLVKNTEKVTVNYSLFEKLNSIKGL